MSRPARPLQELADIEVVSAPKEDVPMQIRSGRFLGGDGCANGQEGLCQCAWIGVVSIGRHIEIRCLDRGRMKESKRPGKAAGPARPPGPPKSEGSDRPACL